MRNVRVRLSCCAALLLHLRDVVIDGGETIRPVAAKILLRPVADVGQINALRGRNDFGPGVTRLAILRENEEKVFEQPSAANDAHESFYPQHYVPGALSLSLEANVAPATYTLVVIVRDKLSGEMTELREQFLVE